MCSLSYSEKLTSSFSCDVYSTPRHPFTRRLDIFGGQPSVLASSPPLYVPDEAQRLLPQLMLGDTPRRGRKAKQRRGDSSSEELDGLLQRWTQRNYSGLNIYDKPSTAFLGWRRLRLKQRRCSATEHQSIHDA
eukprot:scaffold29672_cov22-Cyclotella_meneghiniana.AAC.1